MLVNTQLKKDIQAILKPYSYGGGSRKSTHYEIQPNDVASGELTRILQGETNVPRRVIRGVARITGLPVKTYLVEE